MTSAPGLLPAHCAATAGSSVEPSLERPMVQDKTAGRLSGKVAFLAGATGGIGHTIAERFGRQGARVVVGGRRRSEGAGRRRGDPRVRRRGRLRTPRRHERVVGDGRGAIVRRRIREFAAQRVRVNAIEPVEIAHTAVFLASDESRSLTGQTLAIHRGYFGWLGRHQPSASSTLAVLGCRGHHG